MTEYRTILERDLERVTRPAGFTVDDVRRRRDRKRRNQRLGAGVVGFVVFVAAVWIVTTGLPFDQSQKEVVPGGAETGPVETGPVETGPTVTGPTYTLGPVTREDIAVGDAFSQAWLEGDGEATAAMFTPKGTFDGFQAGILPALHDWFRAGGWTFGDGGCGIHGYGPERGVVGCGFTYENDLTRALGMAPEGTEISFVIDAGRIETAWFGGGGDTLHNMFGSPDPARGSMDNIFGAVWDMFIERISSNHPDDFVRMYDPDRGYPVRGYPILDPASIELWDRYTDEFVASPEALARSFTEWIAGQSFDFRARWICMTTNDRFWAKVEAADLRRNDEAFYATFADVSEKMLAELRALPPGTQADRATMDTFVPLVERIIEVDRQLAAAAAAGDHKRFQELGGEAFQLHAALRIDVGFMRGCLVEGFLG
jgi:hypothetical protein